MPLTGSLYHVQKVFPEAAAAAEGKNKDHNLEFPSDESDDDDYDPDSPATDEKVQGDESSSNESEYASASEELQAPTNDEQYLGFPSDDSEDDDYDPQAPDIEESVKQESSTSDFTSDSEDLAAALDDNVGPKSLSLNSESEKTARESKNTSLSKELLSIQDDSLPVSGKRHIERLDYKRLHDVSIIL